MSLKIDAWEWESNSASFDDWMGYGRRCRLARLGRLNLTHHDPDHDDAFLSDRENQCRKRFSDLVFAGDMMVVDW